jgi:phage baseplate assembly protein W
MASTRTAYSKQNCTFPIERGNAGWKLAQLEKRYEAAVAHFATTPKGSLWRDPEYGNLFFQLRTQSMQEEEDQQLMEVDFQDGFARYLPDLSLEDVSVIADQANERRVLAIVWIVRGADRQIHGRLAEPRKTTVTI